MQILVNDDCKNAPKKEYVKNFLIAHALGDIDEVLDLLADDVIWHTVGQAKVAGKIHIREVLEQQASDPVELLHVEHILSHGNACAANGELGSGQKRIAFSHFFLFNSHAKSAQIKRVTSYLIEMK